MCLAMGDQEFRSASSDISPRCIRKSIDRLELIREYVLWQIGFFIETNQISKKTQILSPLPDREWQTPPNAKVRQGGV